MGHIAVIDRWRQAGSAIKSVEINIDGEKFHYLLDVHFSIEQTVAAATPNSMISSWGISGQQLISLLEKCNSRSLGSLPASMDSRCSYVNRENSTINLLKASTEGVFGASKLSV